MEQIPEWVKEKDFQIYREYMLMNKQDLFKRLDKRYTGLKRGYAVAMTGMILFGVLAILFEILWLIVLKHGG